MSHSILIHRLFEPPRALWSDVPGDEESIALSVKDGHTYHCAARFLWGDGECECGLLEREEINSTISFQDSSPIYAGDARAPASWWDVDRGWDEL